MVRCLAKQDGLVGSHYVRAGEIFDFEGAVPNWAEEVKESAEAKPAPEPKPVAAEEVKESAEVKPAPEPKPVAAKKRKTAKKSGGKTEDLFGE